MASPNAVILLFVTICFTLTPCLRAQPPRPNGKDGRFLLPLRPAPLLKRVPTPLPEKPSQRPRITPNRTETVSQKPTRSQSPTKVPSTTTKTPRDDSTTSSEPTVLPGDEAARMEGGPNCKKLKCRNLNGECTGIKNREWGKIQLAQFSYLSDQTSLIPGGQTLKSARVISNDLSDQSGNIFNSHGLNDLFVFFGQFLDHNLVATPASDAEWNIPNPDGDDLDFTRSTRAMVDGKERPVNTLTSTFDLVAVYGPTTLRNNDLLEFVDGEPTGKLKTSGDGLLPRNSGSNPVYNAPTAESTFFVAGDHRVNEHPALTSLHTIFLREHNYLCDKIKASIPYLKGKQLFEFARKLNIYQFQKIIYEEFYPAIISQPLKKFKFRKKTNPTVSDVFAGAAFRVGHTMVSSIVARRSETGPLPPFEMKDIFFRNANTFSSEEVDNVIRGVAANKAQEVDLKVVDLLRNMLFEGISEENGFDLVALNIQRGRDHNLPSFNDIREKICELKRATDFSDISSDGGTKSDLETAYDNNVDDVEAWPGLVAEDQVAGSGLGETMICLWRLEFTRLRDGDQFFFLRKKKIPKILRKKCKSFFKDLFNKNKKLFRDIIIRNTDITAAQLPSGDIFKV